MLVTVAEPPKTDDIAIIMYTSGSTGVPKGVILKQRNLIATLKGFCDSTPIYETDIMIGFLPLAHVFELLVESVCQFAGVPIGYSGPLTMTDFSNKIQKGTKGDATVLCPTVLTSVPVSYYFTLFASDNFQSGIVRKLLKTLRRKCRIYRKIKKLKPQLN